MHRREEQFHQTQKLFLIVLSIIVTIGLLMILTSSYLYAKETYFNPFYFFNRQCIFIIAGSALTLVVSRTRPEFWIKYALFINFFFCILLLLTLFPGISFLVKGARRWISINGWSFQPGEFSKYSCIFCSIYFFDRFEELTIRQRIFGVFSLLLPLVLLLLQPDFGSFFIVICIMVTTAYLSQFSRRFLYVGLSILLIVGPFLLLAKPYRVQRLLSFLDPWKFPQGTGFQIIQSYLAFAHGSWFGQGLGNSNEKLFYLPEAHNDFIFSVLAEEVGFVGVLVLMSLFLYLIYLGLKLACYLTSRTGFLLISSIVTSITMQAYLNMGIVLGLLPTKGLNLPFISYGGSSLISNFFGIGLILAVARHVSKGQYFLKIE